MENRIFSIFLSLVLLFVFAKTSTFAQNRPEKKDTKTEEQTKQKVEQNDANAIQNHIEHATANQKDTKTNENKMTTDKNSKPATITKDNENTEQVNTQYHKKQERTKPDKQQQEEKPVKGDGKK